MIKQALALSFVLISAQALASTPCPTCKKGYVASSLEETLAARQKAKRLDLKAIEGSSIPQGRKRENAQEKLLITNIVNRTRQNASQSHTSKRNEILGAIDASPKLSPTGSIYFSQGQGNRNLRGTFDRTTALGMQQQFRRALQAAQAGKNSSFKF